MRNYLTANICLIFWLLLFICVKSAHAADLEIYAAWYGTEQQHVDVINNNKIMDLLKRGIVKNQLFVPKNMNVFFGKDPYPGVKKVLAVQVGYNQGRYGEVWNLRQAEGQNLIFPGTIGETYMLAPPDSPVTVNAARYGIDTTPVSADALRRINDTKNQMNGNVYVPADMNKFFGGDPNPGTKKSLAINVTYKGRTFNLRQVEGRALRYPGILGTDFIYVYTQAEVPDARIKDIFDANFYVHKYPDVQNIMGYTDVNAAWGHYINFGIKEGRDPNANLSIGAMQSRYPILQEYFGDNYKQYVLTHIGSGQINADPSSNAFTNGDNGAFANPRLAYFDPDWYYRYNPEVCNDNSLSIPKTANYCKGSGVMDVPALVSHYLTKGNKANLAPNDIPLSSSPQNASGKESMRVGDWLGVNDYLIARNKGAVAVMQSDGNFAVYRTDHPSKANANNFASLHTNPFIGNVTSKDGSYVTVTETGRLCVVPYKNPKALEPLPPKEKQLMTEAHCTNPANAVGRYYLRLENLGNGYNLTIRMGDSDFNRRDYVWDVVTNRPGTPSIWDKAFNVIKTAVGCN